MDELTGLSNKGKKEWITKVKTAFQNGPLVSNVVFSFILAVLEKGVEMEFACPCEVKWNALFTVAFFMIPGILSFLLMMTTQGWNFKCDKMCTRKKSKNSKKILKRVITCSIPAAVWVILLLLDGRYLACGSTYWSGRYIIADEAAPEKWCEPANSTLSQELLIESQRWFFWSQMLGLILLGLIGFGICIRIFCDSCKKRNCQEGLLIDINNDTDSPQNSVPLNIM